MTEFFKKNDLKFIDEYERFVDNHKNGCFMQSINWTKVKDQWDYEAVISRNKNGEIRGAALFLIKRIPFLGCSFVYSPHGPVCNFDDREALNDIFDAAYKICRKHNCYKFLIDPNITESDKKYIKVFKSFGFDFRENAPELTTIQARNNYILKINGRSSEEIFNSFHKKWRYNIRLADRKGVKCKVCGIEALDEFYDLMKETGKRDGFCIRSREYFGRMLTGLGEHCRLYMCYYNGEALSGAISIQYAGKTCYVYGASTSRMRNVMPNYLMQWNMICWAVENKCDIYDFQGIPFYKDENHPNYGVYRFKQGFNGEVMTFAGEFTKTYKIVRSKIIRIAGKIVRKVLHTTPARLLEIFKT